MQFVQLKVRKGVRFVSVGVITHYEGFQAMQTYEDYPEGIQEEADGP